MVVSGSNESLCHLGEESDPTLWKGSPLKKILKISVWPLLDFRIYIEIVVCKYDVLHIKIFFSSRHISARIACIDH